MVDISGDIGHLSATKRITSGLPGEMAGGGQGLRWPPAGATAQHASGLGRKRYGSFCDSSCGLAAQDVTNL
jgi:hypothetical protein